MEESLRRYLIYTTHISLSIFTMHDHFNLYMYMIDKAILLQDNCQAGSEVSNRPVCGIIQARAQFNLSNVLH